MALFGAGGRKTGIKAKPRIELGDGDPVALALVVAANARDWPTVRATLAGYGGNELSLLVSALSKHSSGAYAWLNSEKALAKDDPLAAVVLGSATVNEAWRIRTGARAQHVSQDQFAAFHRVLREAEEHLYTAVELDPESAAPWSLLVTSGRGLQVGLDTIERRFESAVNRCPDHRIAHQQMLQRLCQKWSGSHEQMHEFAEKAIRGPYSAQLAHLIPTAHLEHWLELGASQERRAYMQRPEVRAQLAEAAELSIFRPDHVVPLSPYYEANLFALTFSLAGMQLEARRAFALTDGVVTPFPWDYVSRDQVAAFTLWRKKAA